MGALPQLQGLGEGGRIPLREEGREEILNIAKDHTSRRAILYARVSTKKQASDGYSLAQQMEVLREHAARKGYEVLEEVVDRGHTGATLRRPGMDRVRRLVATGGVSAVLAQD